MPIFADNQECSGLARSLLPRRRGSLRTAFAIVGFVSFSASTALAAGPAADKVVLLGPPDSPLMARLERNFTDAEGNKPQRFPIAVCKRDTVATFIRELAFDAAICTDNDIVSVWKGGDSLQLIEAFPITSPDPRNLELVAARATMTVQSGHASAGAGNTIVANEEDAASVMANANAAPPPILDAITPREAPRPPRRVAPRFLFTAGPQLLASRAGGSFSVQIGAHLGVSNLVTVDPWFSFVPVEREASNAAGSATYRPMLFGTGVSLPITHYSKRVVPRIGAGYALLWMYVWAGKANNPAFTRESGESLWAPVMYINTSLSVKVVDNFRIAAEGMLGSSTHDMVIRIAQNEAAHWGAPLASVGLNAELELP
jgi:hypothetical protein